MKKTFVSIELCFPVPVTVTRTSSAALSSSCLLMRASSSLRSFRNSCWQRRSSRLKKFNDVSPLSEVMFIWGGLVYLIKSRPVQYNYSDIFPCIKYSYSSVVASGDSVFITCWAPWWMWVTYPRQLSAHSGVGGTEAWLWHSLLQDQLVPLSLSSVFMFRYFTCCIRLPNLSGVILCKTLGRIPSVSSVVFCVNLPPPCWLALSLHGGLYSFSSLFLFICSRN